MRQYELGQFGVSNLILRDDVPLPSPGPNEVRFAPRSFSLNYRDLLVVNGAYNPRLALPCTPVSDGAGEVTAVGEGVTSWKIGDRAVTQFVVGWRKGPFRSEYTTTTLGTPGPGLAADEVVLSEDALVPLPEGLDFAESSTLPIAALTAWSALRTEGKIEAGQSVLTLGTGGVSIFALLLGKALGARVLVTSSSDEKLARAKELGADDVINYRSNPKWEKEVLRLTEGKGVDLVVENGGVGTLSQSLRCVRGGGTIGMLGALTGLVGEVNIAPILMKRIRVAGIMVDSKSAFLDLLQFIKEKKIRPQIDSRLGFERLPEALSALESGNHFGKIVIENLSRR